jgi:hypothetical protein
MLVQAQLPGVLKLCDVLNWQVAGSVLSSLSTGHLVHSVDTLSSLWFLMLFVFNVNLLWFEGKYWTMVMYDWPT